MKNLLIIFTRNPELGKVKKRLAKTIGDKPALNIYKFLLQHTKQISETGNFDKAVYYSEKVLVNDIWNLKTFQKYVQVGADLGERMQNAFQQAFNNNYQKVVIIGSDLYDLQGHHLSRAFKSLSYSDAVIGPAQDGGYYLLGLKKVIPAIFKNKSWGSSTVRQDTLNNLTNTSVYFLDMLNDIDIFEDIKNNPVFDKFYKKR
ncbi:MAG: TIGR04282 family arsenosugar biosynthesis glycosyltransferase [Tenacibaculum sp.]